MRISLAAPKGPGQSNKTGGLPCGRDPPAQTPFLCWVRRAKNWISLAAPE